MKIERTINGVKYNIELLPKELMDAYFEQEEKFDIESVESIIEAYGDKELLNEFHVDYNEMIEAKEALAVETRRMIDKYDLNFLDAFSAAVPNIFPVHHKAVTA